MNATTVQPTESGAAGKPAQDCATLSRMPPRNKRQIVVTPETVKEFRARHGLSQQAMSEMLGTHKRTVEQWEAGKNTPPAFLWLALAALEAGLGTEQLEREEERELSAMEKAVLEDVRQLVEYAKESGLNKAAKEVAGNVGEVYSLLAYAVNNPPEGGSEAE